MEAKQWNVSINGLVHKITVRWEQWQGSGEVWDDVKLVDSWSVQLKSTRRYRNGDVVVALNWPTARADECNLALGDAPIGGETIVDREEAETGPGPKRWLVSVLGEDHDIALTQWEAEEEEMVLLLDGEVVQYRESKLDPELLRFTVGEADAVLRLQDERHSLYIGGEFIPGELLTEDVANAEEATLSEQQRVQRYMIGERQEGDNLQPWQAMVKEGNRARNMLGLLAFAGIAALLSVIMANGEIAPSIPSPAIWLLWGLSAVLGFMGINSIVSRESTLGILFGLFGTKTFGGVWSDVTAVIMLALCVLFFSVPFFAE